MAMRLRRRTRTTSYAASPDNSVSLGRLFDLGSGTSQEASSFLPIHDNEAALAWRIALIEEAETSIDAQYYSWHTDVSGQLLISKLIEAADRGVRVRLLLDDIHTFGHDRRIATLNFHPNIEVRLFNPFRLRWSIQLIRVMEFLWFIGRLNHRMHNKLLVADNIIAVIGGRNIGDEYFGLAPDYSFRDLDLLTTGMAVNNFSQGFDVYWNSRVTRHARRIIAFRPGRFDYRHLKKLLKKNLMLNQQAIQRIANLKKSLLSDPKPGKLLIPASARVFYDHPVPGQVEPREMLQALYQCSASTSEKLTIISAYFVPSEYLLDALQELVTRGIKIRVFTNSLASIDVTAVFSGYQRYRYQLLSMGVELYEFRADTRQLSAHADSRPGLSGLHAKSIIFDSASVYVGTLNLDPRSATLNTEAGVMVESPELAKNIREAFYSDLSEHRFWQVQHDNRGRLRWTCGTDSTTKQPSRGISQRIANFIYSRLPIQQHL